MEERRGYLYPTENGGRTMCVEKVSKKAFYNRYCGQMTKHSRNKGCKRFNNAGVQTCHVQRTIGTLTLQVL